jgi:hypothetical protein
MREKNLRNKLKRFNKMFWLRRMIGHHQVQFILVSLRIKLHLSTDQNRKPLKIMGILHKDHTNSLTRLVIITNH